MKRYNKVVIVEKVQFAKIIFISCSLYNMLLDPVLQSLVINVPNNYDVYAYEFKIPHTTCKNIFKLTLNINT